MSDEESAAALCYARDPRRPAPRPAHRRGDAADLRDLDLRAVEPGVHQGYDYSRTRNPTRDALQAALANLEGGARGVRFRLRHGGDARRCSSCSMPARTSSPCTTSTAAATGCSRTCASAPPATACRSSTCRRRAALEAAMRPDTRLVWVETPTNPLLKLVDLAAMARVGAPARPARRAATTPSPRPSSSGRSSTASTSWCTPPPST